MTNPVFPEQLPPAWMFPPYSFSALAAAAYQLAKQEPVADA